METSKTLTKRMMLDRQVKEYIINAIDNSNYDDEQGQPLLFDSKEENPKEWLCFLYDTFRSEYGWHIEQVGEQRAFREWIMGLPSSFNIDFENYKILQIAVKWGSIPAEYTEKQADKILENWFNFITVKTFQLFRKYKIQ